jgi:molybdopterin synthase catalytic subunit
MTQRRAGQDRSGVATRASFARGHWQPCEALITPVTAVVSQTGGYTESVAASTEKEPAARPGRDARFRVTLEPLDSGRTTAAVGASGHGALATFIGLVRDHNAGRRVLVLDYECYEPLALKAFLRIGAEAEEQWPTTRLAIDHRVGRLQIGEASVIIAAGSPHRADAFAACRYAIERIKQIVPIWKREHFEGGDVWIEGATADPDSDEARREALARACS